MLKATGVPPARGVVSASDNAALATQEPQVISVRPTGGINSTIDPADIKFEEFTVSENMRIRYDKPIRRFGQGSTTQANPDGSPVNRLFTAKRLDGSLSVLRVSAAGVYRLAVNSITGSSFWAPIVGIPPQIGKVVSLASVYRKIVMADGVNPLQYISFVDATAPPTAPVAKYVVGFYERVIAAHILNDSDGAILIKWSGSFDGTDASLENFDFSVDESAGFWKLVDSPSDTGDHITGLQAFTNFLVVPRERSIWVGVKQESPANPLRFYCAIPGIGCDMQRTIVVAKDTLIWADARSKGVYVSNVNDGNAQKIDIKVTEQLFNDIRAIVNYKEDIHADYNPTDAEYYLKVGDKIYVYNFVTQAWTIDRGPSVANVTTMHGVEEDIVIASAIDELIGTIDQLIGTIDELGRTAAVPFAAGRYRYFGKADGTILFESPLADTDFGASFSAVWTSKVFQKAFEDIIINRLLIEYMCTRDVIPKLEYSTDFGVTWITVKPPFYAVVGRSNLIILNKTIKGRSFMWRLSVSSGDFAMLRYELKQLPGGMSVSLNP